MEKNIKYKDLGVGIFFIIFSILMYWNSFKIVITVHDAMGPRFFPQLVSIILGILSIILIIKAFKNNQEIEDKKFENIPSIIATILILLIYALLIEKIGFIIMTTLYLFLQILLLLPKNLLKNKKYITIAGTVSLFLPISLYFLFYNVFSIFLPTGILG